VTAKFEYKEVQLPYPTYSGPIHSTAGFSNEHYPSGTALNYLQRTSPIAMIQAEADDGWRLVCIDATHAYFERAKS
jgi:hypothetical protein